VISITMLYRTFTLVVVVIAALVAYWENTRGEVELLPFALCKITAAVLPAAFPSNNTYSPTIFRNLFVLATLSFERATEMASTGVYIDEVIPGERKLVRIFNHNVTAPDQRDVIVFYFAGAWMLGSVDHNDRLCKKLAKNTGMVVVCAEYSLAPEHTFPRGFNDAVAALRWTKHNIERYGGNPNRIFVTGESAGGNLATSVTAHNLDSLQTAPADRMDIIGLLVVYPPTAANFTTESYIKYAKYNGMLPSTEMQHAWRMYAGGVHVPRSDFRYQPLYAPTEILQQFPPTVVIAAEYDVLRDDALMLAERLRAAGVQVELTVYPTIHGFFARDISRLGAVALDEATAKIVQISKRTA
jgi:acetyl esterase